MNTYYVASIADLRSCPRHLGAAVQVLGYYGIGDGGGGAFWWDPTCAFPDDGGTSIQVGASPGRWRRICEGPVNVRWFGALPTVPDCALAIQSALNTGRSVYVPDGNYTLLSGVTLPASGQSLFGDSYVGAKLYFPMRSGSCVSPGSNDQQLRRIYINGPGAGAKTTLGIDCTAHPLQVDDCFVDWMARGVQVSAQGGLWSRGLSIEGCSDIGLYLNGAQTSRVSELYVGGGGPYGIKLDANPIENELLDFTVENSDINGVMLLGGMGNTIRGKVKNTGGSGVYVDGEATGPSTRNSIDCYVRSCCHAAVPYQTAAVHLESSRETTITGRFFDDAGAPTQDYGVECGNDCKTAHTHDSVLSVNKIGPSRDLQATNGNTFTNNQ